jgi:hypothetical protein
MDRPRGRVVRRGIEFGALDGSIERGEAEARVEPRAEMKLRNQVVVSVLRGDLHGTSKERGQAIGGQQLRLCAIADDAAIAHEDDALDFGNDIGEMMGDEQ